MLNGRVKFRIIGDGGKRKKLETALMALPSNNVDIVDPVTREKIINESIRSNYR